MQLLFSSFGESFKILKKDKWILLFSFVPIIIGVALYASLWTWMYGDLFTRGDLLIREYISEGSWGGVIKYLIIPIMLVLLYFVINYTFVLVVSILASPFNDLISSRVEKILLNESPEKISESFKRMLAKALRTIFNELKKIAFILTLTLVAFAISFTAVLSPLSMLLEAVLLAINFVDYSWSRKNISFVDCAGDIKKNIIPYSFAGGAFMFLIAIPIVNLLMLPYGVIYFTILYTKRNL